MAGLYTAPPAQGPMMHDICGTTPLDRTLRWKYFSVRCQRFNPFLNTRAAGIVQADDGSADPNSMVHNLADLLSMCLSERPAHDGEILAEYEDLAAVNGSVSGNHPITGKLTDPSILAGPSGHQQIEFFK